METKRYLTLELKARSENGTLEGYGAVTGNVDSYGDVIAPGAFDNLSEFVKAGGILIGHDWGDLPVAMIEDAREDDKGLWFKARFHSDETAQRARSVVAERLEAGKFVGLSIGYQTFDSRWEERDGKEVRLLTKIKIFEVSVVLTPANPLAGATGAKMKSMGDEYDAALAAVGRLATRLTELKALREQDGRTLSEENLGRARTLLAKSDEIREVLTALLAEPPREAVEDVNRTLCELRLARDRALAMGLV